MYEYPFNPFGKPLEMVSPNDLSALTSVAEGWYVDYKERALPVHDLAKHMCAFANQFGGWLIFGVREAADGSRMAGSFHALSDADVAALSLRIREAATAHAAPPILYEEKRIPVPGQAGALLIIGIPMGPSSPYVHSSGRIYRRLADQSKPREETDRHALDQLWERGRDARRKLISRLKQMPEYPESQAETSWIHVHVVPDLRLPHSKSELSLSQFKAIASGRSTPNFGISAPMTSAQSALGGYVARQVQDNNPSLATLTFRWWTDGVARFDIPINRYSSSTKPPSNYRSFGTFTRELIDQGYEDSEICDLSFFFRALAAQTNAYKHIREATNDARPLYATYHLRNFFYVVPFYDSALYVQQCKDNRLPLMMDREIDFPTEPDYTSMIEIAEDRQNFPEFMNEADRRTGAAYFAISPIATHIFHSMGMIWDMNTFITDRDLYGFDKLRSTGAES